MTAGELPRPSRASTRLTPYGTPALAAQRRRPISCAAPCARLAPFGRGAVPSTAMQAPARISPQCAPCCCWPPAVFFRCWWFHLPIWHGVGYLRLIRHHPPGLKRKYRSGVLCLPPFFPTVLRPRTGRARALFPNDGAARRAAAVATSAALLINARC